ncbi:MAG: hypothetical protein H7230_04470 [Candidatus Parcubacteria bacterium]|nr:hypothetical protein [Candidatus Paceibacterota bacterium]
MSETPKHRPDNSKQGIQDDYPKITPADYNAYRLPESKNKRRERDRATIPVANAEAMKTEKLHKQLREMCNQTHTSFIRQFISWIIDLTVSERLTWLEWIIENTSREKQRSQIFKKFTEQVKRGFSLANPDLNALFILFAEYNKSKDYNREIQTALKKYLDQYDLDSKTKNQNKSYRLKI